MYSDKLDIPMNETEEQTKQEQKVSTESPKKETNRNEESEVEDTIEGDDIVLIMQVEISQGVSKSLQVKRV